MYRNEKKALLEICDTMREIHDALAGASPEERAELCDAAQQGAIKVGESLEKEDDEKFADAVHILEEYCERIFRISGEGISTDEDVISLDEAVDHTEGVVSTIKCRLKVVFFPYKAEMWDSLESFYLAARSDPECDAYLVPIPYFELDRARNVMAPNYDIDRFPAEENPIAYNEFDHTDGSIDIAYIHNPYDEGNLVTSVLPAYYSAELKKYVRKLVYAPYYVTAGFISDDHLDLSVYRNMDYAVFQSEDAKKCCQGLYYYDKILPFGSSKLDMIINKCARGAEIPEKWREIIGDRRTLMLNTSINDMLHSNEATIEKLGYFFDLIKNDGRIAVIWRPHPLLESTFRSMRPDLLGSYEKIKERFIEDNIGVFDDTPDISETVAIADGYIGSGSSSVINLFVAAGKPVFIFNNFLREPVNRNDRQILQGYMEYSRGKLYIHPYSLNALFSASIDDVEGTIKYEGSLPDVKNWTNSAPGPVALGGKLYFAPYFADDAMCYDPVMKTVEMLGSVGRQFDARFAGISSQYPERKTLFFLPANVKYLIMEYLPGKGEWLYHQECIRELYKDVIRPSYIPLLYGGAAYNRDLYYSTGLCNRIMKLEQGTGKYEILYLGKAGFTGEYHVVLKGASDEGLWFDLGGGSSDLFLAPWESLDDSGSWKVIHMPEDYGFVHDDQNDPYGAHGGILPCGEYVIVFPHRAPHMLRINRKTLEMSYMAEDFFRDSEKKGIGYELKFSSVMSAGCLVGRNKYVVQRTRDLHAAIINLDDGSYEEFLPKIPDEIFDKLVPEDAGFFKGDKYDYFRMSESRLFPLENFLEVFARDGYRNIKEQQIEELSSLAANLDGTCGVKTHEYLKKVIAQEDGQA